MADHGGKATCNPRASVRAMRVTPAHLELKVAALPGKAPGFPGQGDKTHVRSHSRGIQPARKSWKEFAGQKNEIAIGFAAKEEPWTSVCARV